MASNQTAAWRKRNNARNISIAFFNFDPMGRCTFRVLLSTLVGQT